MSERDPKVIDRYYRIREAKRLRDTIAKETPNERVLRELNEAVKLALDTRQKWMDEHMDDFARYHVGDVLYDLKTGWKLGTVSKLYRPNWGISGPRETESMSIHYEYETGPRMFDNTSRQMYLSFGTLEELAARREADARYSKWQLERERSAASPA